MLNACLDFDALVFAKAVDPCEVAAAVFPIATLNGIVVKDGLARDSAVDVVGAIVPVAFLEKSGQCDGLFVAHFVIKTWRQVVTPARRGACAQLLRDGGLPIGACHFSINQIANLAIPFEQRNGQRHVEGAKRFTDGVIDVAQWPVFACAQP